ncbi:MAG: trehalase family glycosidase, partial [Bacillota bacterium]
MNLVEEAIETLKANGRGDFTVPSADLYPYQWLWDAGFIALGWGQVSEGRAWQELFSAFKGQWPDGFLPHIVFHRPDPNYFPGPDVWQTHTVPPTSGITQPPVLATATLILYRQARDRELARNAAEELFPKLMAYHRWLYRARDPEGTGLVSILHPWESGMDNSAAWDEPLGRVLPAELPARRKDTSHVHSSERPSDDEYRRYLSLVVRFRDLRYDPSRLYFESPFRVVDVGFNALLHQANQDLRALAIELGKPTEELDGWIRQGTQAFGRLWDDGEGLYFSLDAIAGSPIRVPTSAAFLPLYAGTPDTTAAQHLAFHL